MYRYNGLYGEAPLKRGTFARAGKSVISVFKREQNGSQTNFVAVEKSRKRSGFFLIYSYLKDSAFTAVKRDANGFKLGEEPIYSTANRPAPD